MPEIKLAGKTYDLEGTTFTERSKWRSKFGAPILSKLGQSAKDMGLVDLIPTIKKNANTHTSSVLETDDGDISIVPSDDTPDPLRMTIKQVLSNNAVVISLVSEMIDTAFEAVCSFSKAIADDRDHINKHCTETEIVMALLAMLRVVYPLEVIFGLMGSIG